LGETPKPAREARSLPGETSKAEFVLKIISLCHAAPNRLSLIVARWFEELFLWFNR